MSFPIDITYLQVQSLNIKKELPLPRSASHQFYCNFKLSQLDFSTTYNIYPINFVDNNLDANLNVNLSIYS